MKQALFALTLLLLLGGSYSFSVGQAAAPATSRGHAIEVTYYKGRPFAYLGIGQWAWYELFPRIATWTPKPGELPVAAVKLYTRDEAGVVKVKVTALRGRNHEIEDLVAEYAIGEKTTAIAELVNFGVEPFEVKLVRAPSTVAQLPVITNSTKSLVVGIEPVSSVLPSFKAKFVNGSAKAVTGLAYRTSINGVTKLSGMPQDRKGGVLIEPGETYPLTLRYPMVLITESTGEVPPAQTGLQLNVLAVMFSDGSYEGDPVPAARFRGYKLGEKIQLGRIIALLRSPSAANAESLAPKIDELSYKIDRSDALLVAAEFPGLPEGEIENLRSAAEVSANDVQKGLRATFGKGSSIDPKLFGDAVRGAIAKCEKWLNSLP